MHVHYNAKIAATINQDAVQRARRGIEAASHSASPTMLDSTSITELITDLLHLAAALLEADPTELDTDHIVERAQMHYEEERAGR